jgi:hypothetical protein
MAALPIDVASLFALAIKPEDVTNNCNNIVCQCADGIQILINRSNLIEYLKNTDNTGIEYITYRSVKIATLFNRTSGIFEGELMFMNHQIDALTKLNHALFDNIYYKYLKNDNDISFPLTRNSKPTMIVNCDRIITGKSFKARDYVRETLMHTVNTVLDILRSQSMTDKQVKGITDQFYLPSCLNYYYTPKGCKILDKRVTGECKRILDSTVSKN